MDCERRPVLPGLVHVARFDVIDAVLGIDVEFARPDKADFLNVGRKDRITGTEAVVAVDFARQTERNLGFEELSLLERRSDESRQILPNVFFGVRRYAVEEIPVRHPVDEYHIPTSVSTLSIGKVQCDNEYLYNYIIFMLKIQYHLMFLAA